jgi:hypothetical protein
MELSEELYNSLEEFIYKNEPKKSIPYALSILDLDNGKILYNKMKTLDKTPLYEIFASIGFGYTNFALYKCPLEIIYIIVIQLQTFTSYAIIEDETIFSYSLKIK